MFMRSDHLTIYLSYYSSLKLYFIYMVMLYGSLNHFGSFYSYPNISSYCVVLYYESNDLCIAKTLIIY